MRAVRQRMNLPWSEYGHDTFVVSNDAWRGYSLLFELRPQPSCDNLFAPALVHSSVPIQLPHRLFSPEHTFVQEAKLSDFGDASPTNDGRRLDAGIKKCAWDKSSQIAGEAIPCLTVASTDSKSFFQL
jgi:hypothetical protein